MQLISNILRSSVKTFDFVKKGFHLSSVYNYYKNYKYSSYNRYEFYFTRNAFKKLEDFKKLFEDLQDQEVREMKTLTRIAPLEINFSITEQEVIRKKDKPHYILNGERTPFSHKILFYKSHVGKNTFISQLHFFEKKLLLVKQEISHSRAEDSQRILELFKKKYSLTHLKEIEKGCVRISDTFGSKIIIKTGFKTELTYFHFDSAMLDKVNSAIEASIEFNIKSKRSIEESIMRRL